MRPATDKKGGPAGARPLGFASARHRREKAPAEPDFGDLREGARTNLAAALEKVLAAQRAQGPREPERGSAQGGAARADSEEPRSETLGSASGPRDPAPGVLAVAQALERAVYGASARQGRRAYAGALRAALLALPLQVGPFPDEVVALMCLDGRRSAEDAVEGSAAAVAAEAAPDPREVIRRLFVRTLLRASEELARDREQVLEIAREIEVSCFNAAVRASKESEEPPRRQWDSPAFVDIYSTRCGTLAGLLDPASSSCRAYGATLVERLQIGPRPALSDEPGGGPGQGRRLFPGELGDLSEKLLCPAATAAERAEIAARSEQKVVEKESNLFRCPHCSQRRCSYREVQRRSLDEAPDYLCVCLNHSCGRRFNGRS
jgi:hypothetical protein